MLEQHGPMAVASYALLGAELTCLDIPCTNCDPEKTAMTAFSFEHLRLSDDDRLEEWLILV